MRTSYILFSYRSYNGRLLFLDRVHKIKNDNERHLLLCAWCDEQYYREKVDKEKYETTYHRKGWFLWEERHLIT